MIGIKLTDYRRRAGGGGGPPVLTRFRVTAPATATTGTPISFTVTALDQFGATFPSYAGTVHFTSTDGAAALPANAGLTSGTGTFSATLNTVGNQTITATDTVATAVAGTSGAIAASASAPAATHFSVTAPATATAGTPLNFTVTARDAANNTVPSYAGTVHFTSTDGAAALPANTTLAAGTGTFSATLNTTGNQTLTATDTVTSSINGTSGTIVVATAGAVASQLAITAPMTSIPGQPFTFTVTALDASGKLVPAYAGTVKFASSDLAASVPANSTLTNGIGTFSGTFTTAGLQTLTATDTVTNTITGSISFPASAVNYPQVNNTNPNIYANFGGGYYLSGGTAYSSFSTWLAAAGGTYTRASPATYLAHGLLRSVASGSPRFPADNKGVPQGIRLTGAATNLQINSAVTAAWTQSAGTLTPASVVGPDGTLSAAKSVPDTTNTNNHKFYQLPYLNFTLNNNYTISFFAKNLGYNGVFFDLDNSGISYVVFDLTTGAATLTGAGALAGGAIQLANGWWRCWATFKCQAGGGTASTYSASPTTTWTSFTGDGVSGIGVWGVQVENGSVLGDYVPTTAASATQAADLLTLPYTQTTFSALVNTNNHTVAGQLLGANSGAPILISQLNPAQPGTNNSTSTLSPVAGSGDYTVVHRQMVAGSPTARNIILDGGTIVSDINAIDVSPTTFALGSDSGGANHSNGNYTHFALWNGVVASANDMTRLTGAVPYWVPVILSGANPATTYADFVGGRYWAAGAVQPDFYTWHNTTLGGTFTRGSTATYIKNGLLQVGANAASAGQVRFPSDLNNNALGMRVCVTPSTTNSIVQSAMSGPGWVAQAATLTPNAVTGPDGVANSANAYVPDATTANHGTFQNAPLVTGTAAAWCVSIFAKAAGHNFLVIDPMGAGPGAATIYATFDLTTGAAINTGGTAAFAVQLANGWWWCWFVYTNTAGTKQVTFSPSPVNTYTAAFAGNGTSGLAMYGAQATSNGIPGDYVPTTTTTATQAAESYTYPFALTPQTWSTLVGANGLPGPPLVSSSAWMANANPAIGFIPYVSGSNIFARQFNGSVFLVTAQVAGTWQTPHKSTSAGNASGRSICLDGGVVASDANPYATGPSTAMLIANNGIFGNLAQYGVWHSLVATSADLQRLST